MFGLAALLFYLLTSGSSLMNKVQISSIAPATAMILALITAALGQPIDVTTVTAAPATIVVIPAIILKVTLLIVTSLSFSISLPTYHYHSNT